MNATSSSLLEDLCKRWEYLYIFQEITDRSDVIYD